MNKKRKLQNDGLNITNSEKHGTRKQISDPKSRVRERKKKLKPKKIITSIEEDNETLIIEFLGTREERLNFIESIKEWRTNE